MTNEKWFNNLITAEKAKWLAGEIHDDCSAYVHENRTYPWKAEFWEEWLKKEHIEPTGVAESNE